MFCPDMSSARHRPGIGMDATKRKQLQLMRSSCTKTQMYLLSSSVVPATASNGTEVSESFKLPLLTRTLQHLSTSDPSLFIPSQRLLSEPFSCNWHLFFQKHTLTPEPRDGPRQEYRPVYTHFSHPLRPISKPKSIDSPSWRLYNSQRVLRPLVKQNQQPQFQEDLSIRGTACFSRPVPTMTRKQLHVFIPVEGTEEQDHRDSESIDEGFMDEVDHKIALLKKQETKTKRSGQSSAGTSVGTNFKQLVMK